MITPPGFPKHIMTWRLAETISSATTISWTAKEGMTPLAMRFTPVAIEAGTCTIALTDDGSTVAGTQDSTTLTAATTRQKVFTQGGHILSSSALVITITPTTGTLTDTLVEFEYYEG